MFPYKVFFPRHTANCSIQTRDQYSKVSKNVPKVKKRFFICCFLSIKVNQRERDQMEQKLNDANRQIDQLNEELALKKESFSQLQQLLTETVNILSN